jgi:hypothetical protein
MNALMETYALLTASLAADPLLLLASAVTAFDPLWASDEWDDINAESDPLAMALHVTRSAFPDIYALAVERMRAGAGASELDRLICDAISARGIPLNDLETIGWGIPLDAVGVNLEDPEFYKTYADLLPILAAFGITAPEDDLYSVPLPEGVYTIGRALADQLVKHSDAALQEVGWALAWLFSCSGNTLVDLDDEALAEVEPLSWSADDVNFAVTLIEETDDLIRDVQAGLEWLLRSPDLLAALKHNADIAYRQLNKKGELNERALEFSWAGAGDGAERTTLAHSQLLQLRSPAA